MQFPTKTEMLILGLLAGGEKYGLQLVKDSGGKLKRGTIYVLLDRLEDKGFITSKTPEPGSARRLYTIHGSGVRALRAQEVFEHGLPAIGAMA